MTYLSLQPTIEEAFLASQSCPVSQLQPTVKAAIETTIHLLDCGEVRVAEKIAGQWQVNDWLKKAILLYFQLRQNELSISGCHRYFDKIPLKFTDTETTTFTRDQLRIVPPAAIRYGAYLAQNTILMPSYVNIGAYVDSGTMIDTWATVGSCAQIGKNVHLSGGTGIGGVLEPMQACPTIIEDGCFIGARSEIAEGVIVGEGAVIAMGMFIGQSTPIYNRTTGEITYGYLPPYSVVVPGTLPREEGKYSLQAAIIVKQVDARTRHKTSLNDLLRFTSSSETA